MALGLYTNRKTEELPEWSNLGANSINKIYTTLGGIYKFARRHGVKNNPLLDVKKKKENVSRDAFDKADGDGIVEIEDDKAESDRHLRRVESHEVYTATEVSKLIAESRPGAGENQAHDRVFDGGPPRRIKRLAMEPRQFRAGTYFRVPFSHANRRQGDTGETKDQTVHPQNQDSRDPHLRVEKMEVAMPCE